MTRDELNLRLERAAASRDVVSELENLVGDLSTAGRPTLDSVEVILEFMELHGHLDLGLPGPLTHYMERLHGHGYEAKLLESLLRRPTELTVWMLNRLINGTKDPGERDGLIAALLAASGHSLADAATRVGAKQFLERLALVH